MAKVEQIFKVISRYRAVCLVWLISKLTSANWYSSQNEILLLLFSDSNVCSLTANPETIHLILISRRATHSITISTLALRCNSNWLGLSVSLSTSNSHLSHTIQLVIAETEMQTLKINSRTISQPDEKSAEISVKSGINCKDWSDPHATDLEPKLRLRLSQVSRPSWAANWTAIWGLRMGKRRDFKSRQAAADKRFAFCDHNTK